MISKGQRFTCTISSISKRCLNNVRYFCSDSNEQQSIVVALGGNAMKKPNEQGTYEEMKDNVESATNDIMKLAFNHNYKLALTHGNGPQIGSIYLQNEIANDTTPALPLSICGSMTQGYLGYMLQQSIANHLRKHNNNNIKGVITCVTQVKVNLDDKAWESPSKPVGQFYSCDEAKIVSDKYGYFMMNDSGRGYRYAVASPKPMEIIEIDGIKELYNLGYIVIACGGGGIPVILDEEDRLQGRDAVIDKDLTAVILATQLKCNKLMIATDIDGVYLNYLNDDSNHQTNKKKSKLGTVRVNDMIKYYEEGHFGKGSMGPKILAAIQFVQETGCDCIIGALNEIEKCVVGEAGTRIIA